MAACIRCWRKARPIFKQHILALYPSHADSLSITAQNPVTTNTSSPDYSLFHDPLAQPRNLGDLTFYAQMFPNKLTRIGRYMTKKMKQHIRDNNPRFVHLSMLAMIGLVDACHSDDLLILYDGSVCEELRLLLVHPNVEHRILAAQGLCKLMNFIDDSADFRKYEAFFPPLISMCAPSPPDSTGSPNHRKHVEQLNRLHISGLQGLSAMVIHFYSQRLVDHYQEVIPAALANVRTEEVPSAMLVEGNSVTSETISACAYETLSLLAAKVSIPDLDSALTPLFEVLDAWQWHPVPRCAAVMSVMTNGLQSDCDLVLFEVLKHALVLEQKVQLKGDPIDWKGRIVHTAALLISAMRINVLHWEGIVDLLIHHAVAASRSSSPSAPAYMQSVHSCYAAYAQKMPTAQDLISLLFHLSQYSHTSASTPLKASLLSCANAIVLQSSDLSLAPDASFASTATVDSLVRSLLTCAVSTQEIAVRERVYELLTNLLLPALDADDDPSATTGADSRAKVQRLLTLLAEGKRGDEKERSVKVTEKEQRWILTILYHELSSSIAVHSASTLPSVVSSTVVDPVSSSSLPPAVALDSIVIVVDDEKSLTSNLKAPGRGATSARAFEAAYQLLVALLYQSPAASLVLQWPLLSSLHQLASSPHILSPPAPLRLSVLLEAWLSAVARIFSLSQARETRQSTAELDAFISQLPKAWPLDVPPVVDVAFDPQQPSRGLVAIAPTTTPRPYVTELDLQEAARLLSRLLDAAGATLDAEDSEAGVETAGGGGGTRKELQAGFEPFNVKFLPPSKPLSEERETSWAPSNRPEKERRYSFDTRESVTRVDSPYHSAFSPKLQATDRALAVGAGAAVGGADPEDAKAIGDDQSYAAVATAYNAQTARSEQAFRQSMRILVDQTIHDDTAPSTAHTPHTPASSTSASVSKPTYSRRRSLSTRRQSGMQTGPLSTFSAGLASASASATADKFFAAPAVAAPPTLDVNAAIRQQIESSYALSPSHAVSGSVNVNGVSLEDEGAALPVKLNVRRASHSAQGSGGGSTTGAGSLTGSGKEGHADWTRESWMLAEQRIDVGSVDEGDDEDAQLTDEIVYGLAEDMEGLHGHHIAGTGENILKFQFPVLNTFDSYVPELD